MGLGLCQGLVFAMVKISFKMRLWSFQSGGASMICSRSGAVTVMGVGLRMTRLVSESHLNL